MVDLYSKNLFIADILDAVASPVIVTNAKGQIVHCNRAFQLCAGYSLQEARGETYWDLLSAPQEIEETKRVRSQILSSNFPLTFRTHMPTRKGHRHVSWSGKALSGHQGTDQSIIITGTDVTAIGQDESEPQQDQENLAIALANLPMSLSCQNHELRYTWTCNPRPPLFPEQVLGKRDEDFLPGEDAHRLTQIKRGVFQTGIGAHKEVRLTIDDETCFYDLFAEPIAGADGSVVGVSCIAIDISKRKREELGTERLIEQVSRQGVHLVDLGERLLKAQRNDNKQYVRELREQMKHSLAALNLSVYLVRDTGEDGEAREATSNVSALGEVSDEGRGDASTQSRPIGTAVI
jgi:PAS domain S-box-containing protein